MKLPFSRDTLLAIGGDYVAAVDVDHYIKQDVATVLEIIIMNWKQNLAFLVTVDLPIELPRMVSSHSSHISHFQLIAYFRQLGGQTCIDSSSLDR